MHVCAFATLQSALRDLRQGLASTETLQKEAEDEAKEKAKADAEKAKADAERKRRQEEEAAAAAAAAVSIIDAASVLSFIWRLLMRLDCECVRHCPLRVDSLRRPWCAGKRSSERC